MPDLLPTLSGEQLFADILQLEHDPEQEAHLVQRRGLKCVSFRRDGRLIRRYLPSDIAEWLAAESAKKNGKVGPGDGDRGRDDA